MHMIIKYKINYLLLACIFLLLNACSISKNVSKQEPKIEIDPFLNSTRDIKVIAKIIETDQLGQIYIVDTKNALRLYGSDKLLKGEYSNNRYGLISSVDASNPLNPIVFFKDHGHILVLDNNLALVKDINLTSGGKFMSAGPVCLSNDKQYWVFDPQIQKIVKINDLKEILVETNHLNDIDLMGITPEKLDEAGNNLVAFFKNRGFVVFDNFGQYIKTIPIENAIDFQFDGKSIIYKSMTGLKSQGINYPNFVSLGLPLSIKVENTTMIKIGLNQYIAAYNDGVDIVNKL